MENKEIWKDIEGFEGKYQISSMGRVKSLNFKLTGKEQIMSLKVNKYGYKQILLYKDKKYKTFLIHRLVAQAFIPNPENKPEIDHINTNKTDNRVENLDWCTAEYNHNYGTRNDRIAKALSKPVLQFSKTDEFIKKWNSIMDIKRELNISHQNISKCCLGKIKTAYKFKWGYEEDYEKVKFKVFDLEIYRKKTA